jgi:hypothetical protein
MSNNPFPDEKSEATIEELQPRARPVPVPQTPTPHQPASHPVNHAAKEAETQPAAKANGEAHTRDDALTIKFAIGKLNDYLQWFLMVLESVLAIRFLLKLFGADPANLFASFIFSLTEILLVPFATIVQSPSLHENQAFEISTLIAALIYFLIFYALKRFLRILISSPEEE